MRWLLVAALTLWNVGAIADDLVVYRVGGLNVAVRTSGGNLELVGLFDSVAIVEPLPPVVPDEPTGPGQLICVRPWSCSLDESDADLTIRESLDAVQSKLPYIRVLPGTLDERMQPHAIERYRGLVKDATKAWVFHVVPTRGKPRILHQGPLDANAVLGWVGVKRVAFAEAREPPVNEAQWLDVDFSKEQGRLLGAIEPPEWMRAWYAEAATDVSTIPGFRPIQRSEWSAWTSRFPVTRLARSIRNVTEQTMGSCVGHCCANCVEAGCYMQAGDLFFRRLSGMSMYVRIGRSPNSGAYIGDAAAEIFDRGILPVEGEPYPATFPQDTGWSVKLPTGWENTARLWKASVFRVESEEHAFRVLMDWRLRTQFGRSSHSVSGFAVTASGKWAYENSWGIKWGDLGKSVGYDSRFYDSYVYMPVLRDEVAILMARELDELQAESFAQEQPGGESATFKAYRHFDDRLDAIQRLLQVLSAREKEAESVK